MNEQLVPLSEKHAKAVAMLFQRLCKLDASKWSGLLEAIFATAIISYGELTQLATLAASEVIAAARSNGVLLALHPFNLFRGLITQVSANTATCDVCGAFPVNPVTNQMELRDSGTCPNCQAGLLTVERQVSEFASWVTGGKVPIGTVADLTVFPGVNIPLTLEGVQTEVWRICQKDIHAGLQQELVANEVSVLGFLQYLKHGTHALMKQFRNPLEYIESLGAPEKFGMVSPQVIRLLVRGAKAYLSQPNTPASAPAPATRAKSQTAHEAMCSLLPTQFDELLFKLAMPLHYLSPGSQSSRALEVIRYMESQGRSSELTAALGLAKASWLSAYPFDWSRPEVQATYKELAQAYDDQNRLRQILRAADVSAAYIDFSGGSLNVLYSTMEVLVRQGKLETFLRQVLQDPLIAGHHPKIRALTGL